MYKPLAALLLAACLVPSAQAAGEQPEQSINRILAAYMQAVGGEAAINRIRTREVQADQRHGPKLTYYWQAPDKILLITKKQKIGFDGGSGWVLSKKRRITRLPKGAQKPLETDANPIRFVHLKSLYSEIDLGKTETIDEVHMDVLIAPNDIGATKFYFDPATHLLRRIEETGETSAYYKQTTEFLDYQEVDGIRFPFRIVHSSTEPGMGVKDIRVSDVQQNVPLKPDIFSKPTGGAVVFGGKR